MIRYSRRLARRLFFCRFSKEGAYNAEGLRVSKTVDGVTTWFCYEYSRVIKEIDSNNNAAYNVYGINLIFRRGNYYLYNGQGDVTMLYSAAQLYIGAQPVIANYYYDAFGVVQEESGLLANSIQNSVVNNTPFNDRGIDNKTNYIVL